MQKPVIVETKKRYAVCIGINHYRDSQDIPALRYAEKDAQAVYELILQRGFAQEDCRLLLGSQATQQAIHDALKTVVLDKPRKEDLVLFYFAGHGIPISLEDDEEDDALSDVFLTCVDFPLQEIRARRGSWLDFPLRLERLRTQFFERTRSKKVLFILDSCHSGDFYGSQYRGSEIVAHDYIDRAFGRMSAGRVVLSSCMPQQKAYEDEKWQHGRFTYHLLDALEGNQRNAVGRDGWITVSSLFDYLAKTMRGAQCPVESGVKHGSFELLYYSTFDETLAVATEAEPPEVERVFRLRALFAKYQEGLLYDRLASFVGREKELAEIRVRIARQQQTGGYLIITGQAGQGKSSIIAKLVEEYGPDNVAYHFIPFNLGPDHQMGLLRNLMARLILKYHLPEFYVASESRGALRDYFPKVLDEVAAQGGREVIFIDGLDQIESETTGNRDLSFLPNNLPSGIVFVVSLRPNDTRNLLEVLINLHDEYPLPDLSRQDFDLILQHRGVTLEYKRANQFYEAVQKNALYLDLVAKELLETDNHLPDDIIARLTSNPDNLFSLTMIRLKRDRLEWREVLKPLLGVLLVVQAPLSKQSLRQILKIDADQLNEGLAKLGGLLVEDEQQRYSLFHLKLQEYLREDEVRPHKEYIFAIDEVQGWHSTLASWCKLRGLSLIWENVLHNEGEQSRRLYARHYYLIHLYEARQWERLFEELDAGQYGRSKLHFDPSMRLYTQDLNCGRSATAWEGWGLEEGIALLPQLWSYTLLQCSLASRADNYPEEAFELLLLLKREPEALNLVELLTDPAYKVRVLSHIAKRLNEQLDRQTEGVQMLIRACTVSNIIQDVEERAVILSEIAGALAHMQQWEQANDVCIEAVSLTKKGVSDWALRHLSNALAHTQQWEQAKTIIHSMERASEKVLALSDLGSALSRAQQQDHATAIWEEAEVIIDTIEKSYEKALALGFLEIALAQSERREQAEEIWKSTRDSINGIPDSSSKHQMLCDLGSRLVQAEQWEYANTLVLMIEIVHDKIEVLTDFGSALTKAGWWEKAQKVLEEVETLISTIKLDSYEKHEKLCNLGIALAQNKQWERAKAVIHAITWEDLKVKALSTLGSALVKGEQKEQAEIVWGEIQSVMYMVEDHGQRFNALHELGNALTQVQQWENADMIWQEAKAEALTIIEHKPWETFHRDQGLTKLVSAFIRAQQWERAEAVLCEIKGSKERVRALCELGNALEQAQLWEHASLVWEEAEKAARASSFRDEALSKLVSALIRAQQWSRAETVVHEIEDSEERVCALCELSNALEQAQLWEHASLVWEEVEKAAPLVVNISFFRHNSLSKLVSSFIRAQRWTSVEAVVREIESQESKVQVLGELGSALVRAQQWEYANTVWSETEAILQTIEESRYRAQTLIDLGSALVQAQRWESANALWLEAEAILQTMEDSDGRSEDLSMLGRGLVQAQQWERAKALACTIEDDYQREWVLYDLVKALAQAEQWENAEVVVSMIKQDFWKVRGVCELGVTLTHTQYWKKADAVGRELEAMGLTSDRYQQDCVRALAQMAQWEQAETVLRSMKNNSHRAEALCEMADALAKTNEHGRLLRLVQRWWPQVKTRGEALTLLALASELIALKPDIGMAFYEAFAWVDAFLQRAI